MSSRTAKFLVIFVVAIIAFCLACVCAAMTGPISILPNESDNGSILDDLSAIANDTGNNVETYTNQYDDYSSGSGYSSSSDSYVETTTDDSSSDSGSNHSDSSASKPSDNNYVETTTEG